MKSNRERWCAACCALCIACRAAPSYVTNDDVLPRDVCGVETACPEGGSGTANTTGAVLGIALLVGAAAILQWQIWH